MTCETCTSLGLPAEVEDTPAALGAHAIWHEDRRQAAALELAVVAGDIMDAALLKRADLSAMLRYRLRNALAGYYKHHPQRRPEPTTD